MIIQYPQELLDEVQERVVGHNLAGFTPGQGKLRPDLMLVGEAPGRHEEVHNIPFSGASGKELMKMLSTIGYDRESVYITSVVRQRPYSIKKVTDKKTGAQVVKKPNRTPTKKEVLAFANLFDWELEQVQPKIIVPLGNTALQRLLGSQVGIGQLHGHLLKQPIQHAKNDGSGYELAATNSLLVPMYHPAAILYSRKLESTVYEDWQRLGKIIKKINS
ncbi:uracil-DNA glycosylase [Limosilactobacillus fastidiosus]|uniref:Uracil-DNA glycosylase n=1 Tax=Limosilactobacillus fastidiosus TaxID=2759855 RepID=A0A7W3TZN4_9LACO|nr:uracil-DNA glycosylase [Limosilactobacillus fastidiosus]MBB1063379.1 uracil-DNA glycosylase [Limosilactobacillus fastidiosus]MBB1085940.1 uracil-DNA glycosylase [Limosilactobacillus fastidiosus]MCD7084647.1 uracil-DNA glycosylase [Limosilactobacillus fastidiosus]MCD7085723.1 uracil-DNA glycosylase [Limosilactobacillus fastidiosus]MCD7113800.1 uracil-DNA glycosylase [Limosilactobacillus fastidiosus]